MNACNAWNIESIIKTFLYSLIFFAINHVQAQTIPAEWNKKIWAPGNGTCISCHAFPLISNDNSDVQNFNITDQTIKWITTSESFKTHMSKSNVRNQNDAMKNFADMATPNELESVRNYFLGIRNAVVTPSPVGSATEADIQFGTFSSTTTAEQPITITNPRSQEIRYNSIAVSGAINFSVVSNSCSDGIVVAGGTCTIKIRYTTLSRGTNNAIARLSFSGLAINDPPPLRIFNLEGTYNPPPEAIIGSISSSRVAGDVITLDGSTSRPLGSELKYSWSVSPSTNYFIQGQNTSLLMFTPNIAGRYDIKLTVTDKDNRNNVATATLNIVEKTVVPNPPSNNLPIAKATASSTGLTGALVTLNSSGSTDADNDPLTYSWVLDVSKAEGSTASLNNAAAPSPTFTADRKGFYTATLTVNDGKTSGLPVSVTVNIKTPGSPFDITNPVLKFTAALGASDIRSTLITNNPLTTPLLINSLTFEGAAKSEYSLAPGNTCVAGALVPDNGCTLAIQFTPTVISNARDAQLSIAYGGTDGPQIVLLNGNATPGPQGHILVGSSLLEFPDTQIGTKTSVSTTVRNDGDRALVFTAFTPGGVAANDFQQGGTCSLVAPLARDTSCTVVITFNPAAAGRRNAILSILSDASNGTATLTLAGTGLVSQTPQTRLSPAPLDFGVQTVGGLYPTRRLTLTNIGAVVLTNISVAVQGTGFANAETTFCPAILQEGDTCDIEVAFTPLAAQTNYAGTVLVTSNGAPVTAALTGRGVATSVPALFWAPAVTQLDFGQVAAGTVSPVQTVTLRNQGPGGVSFRLINSVGVDASVFAVTIGSCPSQGPLYEGTECKLEVRFSPGSSGDKKASIQVVSNGSFPPEIALRGTGLAGPSPVLTLSFDTLNFNTVRVGAQSVPQEITLSNRGSGVVTISALQAIGAFAMQNKTCGAPPFVIQAGSSCAVALTFAPSSTGPASGVLRVTSDATPATREVALIGNGEAQPSVSGGGGGCSMASGDSLTDPTLWALALLAFAALIYRDRSRSRGKRRRT